MLDIKDELEKLPEGWSIESETILKKTFQFKGFLKTMSFVNAVAWEANRVMHHPDMIINFNKCTISMTTHDAGNKLTEKDFLLAKNIELLLS